MKRRDFLSTMGMLPFTNILWNEKAFAEDMPQPSSNRFMLYIHMGSACGMSSGLVQPLKRNQWPRGWFEGGKDTASVNPLMNVHTEGSNGMIFHDYLKFLAPISEHMCLVNGTSQSLDHGVARLYQQRGVSNAAIAPEWPMAVTEFMRTAEHPNPMMLSSGVKTLSVPSVTTVQASNIDEFSKITQDVEGIPKAGNEAFIELLKRRFTKPALGSIITDSNLQSLAAYQLATLTTGLKELASSGDDIKTLKGLITKDNVGKLIQDCVDSGQILNQYNKSLQDNLILAGILAKTGLANGMSLNNLFGLDTHNTPCDIETPRVAGAAWAQIHLFWNWVKANNLQDDIMIVVSHDFSRSAYNGKFYDARVKDKDGKEISVKASGRDHDLSMGMMFLNSGVPKGGRVGHIAENRTPLPSKDTKGTPDTGGAAYTAENMVGSMLLRIFPELFPTERMVRKHWPTFKEIASITS